MDLIVRPMMENYVGILSSFVGCFVIQFGSAAVTRKAVPKTWEHLEKTNNATEFLVRCVSNVHGLITATLIPSFFLLPAEIRNDPYGYDPYTQLVLSISVGYFLWDLWVCVHYRWPIAFWGHGICCFAVMYSGLHPFFHQQARFFLGFFEMSTVLLNVYKQLQACGHTSGPLYLWVGLVFSATFTVVRILIGIPYSIWWWGYAISLFRSGKAHSRVVIIMHLVSNLALNVLNLVWWKGILVLAGRRLGFTYGETKVD